MYSTKPIGTRMWRVELAHNLRKAEALVCAVVCMALLSIVLAGCSGSSISGAKAGAISVTGSSGSAGQITSLVVGAAATVSMTPTGDSLHTGVDWTVVCEGNPVTGSITNDACGTLSPAHTADGAAALYTAPPLSPIGTSVTIKASVTSNPSQSSTANLTIVGLPITVSFTTGYVIPSSLAVSGAHPFGATVTNDATNAGVYWTATCASSACGSFSRTITTIYTGGTSYVAPSVVPAGGTVTVTATSVADTTKSVSATIAITSATPPPAAIAVTVSPATVYVQTTAASRKVTFTATVSNDTANQGVDWKVSCSQSSCGQVAAHTASGVAMTFTGPSVVPPGNGTVRITATSTTDPTVSASAVASIVTAAPVVVSMSTTSPVPASLITGSQTLLAATAVPDSANLGVNWTATCGSAGACGSFNLSPAHTASGGQILYTAPAAIPTGGVVTITASSPVSTPSNPAIAATTIVAQPPTLAFQQVPPTPMVSLTKAPVSAGVSNDVSPGGVTWSVQCGSSVAGGCGWITPAQTASGATATYTAPPPVASSGTSVTIVAASTADPQVTSTKTVTISLPTSPSVGFTPLAPSQVQAGATVNLTASIANDLTKAGNDLTNAGVDWQVCASGCGYFTIKPAIPAITTATTTIPEVPAVQATTASGWSNGLSIPYTAPSQAPASGTVVVVAASHAQPTAANSAVIAIDASSNGPALNGIVQAGVQPVVGASVALYAAGSSGYASAAAQISAPGTPSTATTDSSGNFVVPGGYSCPQPNSQIYLVAVGGKVGANAENSNLALMTALGSCSSLSSSNVVVNEVTTVASAYATAPFASNDALTGISSYLYLGTSSSNPSGLANAFAAVNNLVDISTGQVRYVVPAGNAEVPYAEINTLANMLNACTATAGGLEGDGSACDTLFTAADTLQNHSLYNSVAPTDTLQAVYNIAQHPMTTYGYQLGMGSLAGLSTANSPFQPTLTTQPNDWSISLHYTGGDLTTGSTVGSFAVDATGNLWITEPASSSVLEWNSVGAAITPPKGFPAGGGPIAIDVTGNVWISGDGVLTELTSLGSQFPGSPFGGVAGGGGDMAIDAQSNLWIADGTGVAEFNSLGAEISPSGGYLLSGITGVEAVGIDSSNHVWAGFNELTNPGGQPLRATVDNSAALPEIASDGAGNIWSIDNSGATGLCKVPPYGGIGIVWQPDCDTYIGGGTGLGNTVSLSYFNARGIAMDGAGTVWLASQGGTANASVPPSVLPIIPSLPVTSSSGALASSSLAAGTLRVAVDGSGNIWVLLADNTVTEFVGAATPVVTPLALGVKNKKLAEKP